MASTIWHRSFRLVRPGLNVMQYWAMPSNSNGQLHLSRVLSRPTSLNFHTTCVMEKKDQKKGKANTKTIDQLVDDIVEEEEEDEEAAFKSDSVRFKETELKNFFSSKGKGKKPAKGAQQMKYEEFVSVVNGELLWKELENKLDNLKSIYLHQLSVRSATSIDEVPVLFEGDTYPLKEIASISKKDPKKVIIDASAFPQASVNIMAALRDSGMNLNPQQEGLTIYVPIPKVTKEFREKLAGGAKKKLNECKDELRKVQNKFAKQVSEKELSGAVAKDDARASSETIKAITDHFMAQGDQLLSSKTKDILGK